MIERARFGHLYLLLAWIFVVVCGTLALTRSATTAAASVKMQRDGSLQIAGQNVRCGNVRNVLDPDLPGLGMAGRRVVALNPELLERYSPIVRLFVFHHECGHHNVGSDELAADCWAVRRGLRDGWLSKRDLTPICKSFGNAPETDTHPSAPRRCASLERCFMAAAGGKRELRVAERTDFAPSAQTKPRPLAMHPATVDEPSLPIGLLVVVFVALVWAAAPRRRRANDESLEPTTTR